MTGILVKINKRLTNIRLKKFVRRRIKGLSELKAPFMYIPQKGSGYFSKRLYQNQSKKAIGGELFSRLAKDRGERRRRTEAGARSRSFVFCALDWRQYSFSQPAVPRRLSLVAYKTPLTPAKNELLTRATSASIRRLFPSLYRPRKASPPLGMGLADVTRRMCLNVACHHHPHSPRVRYLIR